MGFLNFALSKSLGPSFKIQLVGAGTSTLSLNIYYLSAMFDWRGFANTPTPTVAPRFRYVRGGMHKRPTGGWGEQWDGILEYKATGEGVMAHVMAILTQFHTHAPTLHDMYLKHLMHRYLQGDPVLASDRFLSLRFVPTQGEKRGRIEGELLTEYGARKFVIFVDNKETDFLTLRIAHPNHITTLRTQNEEKVVWKLRTASSGGDQ